MHRFMRVTAQQGFVKHAVIGAPATARRALFTQALRVLDDHSERDTHQRTNISRQTAIAPSDQYFFVFPGDVRHDLFDARIFSARIGFELFKQADFGRRFQRSQRVKRAIKRVAEAVFMCGQATFRRRPHAANRAHGFSRVV